MKYLVIFAAMGALGSAPAWAQDGGAAGRTGSTSRSESAYSVPGSSTGVAVGVNAGDRLPPSLAGTADTTTPGGPLGLETPTSAPSPNAHGGPNDVTRGGASPGRDPVCKPGSQDHCSAGAAH